MILRTLVGRSNRAVFSVMLLADVVVFGAGAPLEKYSLWVAADKSSSAATVVLLLFGNLALLGTLFVAITCSTLLINRVVARLSQGTRSSVLERGEIEAVAATAGRP